MINGENRFVYSKCAHFKYSGEREKAKKREKRRDLREEKTNVLEQSDKKELETHIKHLKRDHLNLNCDTQAHR